MEHLYKAYFGKIFCELGIAKNPRATLLLCPGLPGIPKEQELLKKLLQEGYNVLYPRYCGTFESDGLFLEQSPTDDLKEFLNTLKKPFTELYGMTEQQLVLGKLIILGASFGASVGLDLAAQIPAKGVFVAPIINFAEHGSYEGEETIQKIGAFMQRTNKHTYRVAQHGYEHLATNKLIKPLTKNKYPGSILLHGIDDKTVNIKQSETLSQKTKITLKKMKGGHISCSALPYNELINHISSLL